MGGWAEVMSLRLRTACPPPCLPASAGGPGGRRRRPRRPALRAAVEQRGGVQGAALPRGHGPHNRPPALLGEGGVVFSKQTNQGGSPGCARPGRAGQCGAPRTHRLRARHLSSPDIDRPVQSLAWRQGRLDRRCAPAFISLPSLSSLRPHRVPRALTFADLRLVPAAGQALPAVHG